MNGGPSGQNSNYIGIDAISIISDTTRPVITHSKIPDIPKYNWPQKVKCVVSNPYNIDSVWVRWKKNSGSSSLFNLNRDSADNWSGTFNSDSSQVNVGDSIFYRIIARSASTQQTLDSTILYGFRIISQHNVVVGNDTISSNYPFCTYWMDGRTDLLYLSDEIKNAGGSAGEICKIGFYLIPDYPVPMHGFNVKMQNTTSDSISDFTYNNWTVCYNGDYTVLGTGLQFINLTTPFNWNSSQNLLVEICYTNEDIYDILPVYATAVAYKMVVYMVDNSEVNFCTRQLPSNPIFFRSNACFVINNITNIQRNVISNPSKFNLSQNYPNPFNPNTKIDYAIPKNGFVSLKIYDILGREIKSLVNENKTTGYYSVDFNGSEFSSGVYFYKLESNGFNEVKKMMLIK